MKYSCNDDQYRAFLCYRRKASNPLFAPSEDVAGMLHWWLNYGPKLAKDGPALFEECYPQGGSLTYGEEGIERFVPQMEMAFVVLCPGFFRRTLDVFYDTLVDHAGKPEQVLLRLARERLSVQDRDVCFLEIQRILAAENCRVIPVLVKVGGREACADLQNRDITWLKKILGQGSEVLFDTINSCTVDYDQLASFVNGLCWAEMDEQTTRTRMRAVEAGQEGAALLHCLKQMLHLHEVPDKRETVKANTILADLKRCARTFLNQQQPSGDDYFRAGNPRLIYDPIRSCNMKKDPMIKPPFLAACLVESFRENQKAFGLQMDRFTYWNVNLNTTVADVQELTSIPLSVCAVCFGTLSVHHYLRKERSRLQEAPLPENVPNPILKTIRSGQNLLLALRNPYTKTWPSTWEFNNKAEESIGVEGTTNQTTLSLSTLMSCGFLAPDIPQKYLKARYDYIWESVDVLLSWGVPQVAARRIMGWRYTPESRNAPALLPTVFVFDTLCKLRQSILELLPVFSAGDAFQSRLQQDLLTVEQTLTEILGFIEQKQCGDISDAPGAFRRFGGTEYSVTHTAYVIKSLYQYILDHGGAYAELEGILEPAIAYLMEKMEAMKLDGDMHFREWERYEDFCDSDPNDNDSDCLKSTFGEQYEHCAELIIGEALIKIAENTTDAALCSRVMALLQWLFGKYLEEKRLVGIDGDTVRVRGVRSFLPFPIYALYYYRMFLWDYLLLLEKKEACANG